jgi:hypothetical protein
MGKAMKSLAHDIAKDMLVVLVLVVVGVVVALYLEISWTAQQGDAPATVVRQLCSLEMQRNYGDAWDLFDGTYRTGTGRDLFIQVLQQRDQQVGSILGCRTTGRDYLRVFGPTNTAIEVQVRLRDGTRTGEVLLTGSAHSWAVDYIDPLLRLDQ